MFYDLLNYLPDPPVPVRWIRERVFAGLIPLQATMAKAVPVGAARPPLDSLNYLPG